MPRCKRCTLNGGKKRSKKSQTRKRRAGTLWSTIRYGTKDIKDCYDGTNQNASVNIGPALSALPNSLGVGKCEDYYMGAPGDSSAKNIIDNCNRLVYSNSESWQPGNKKLFFCRKGENKTGQCRTSSFKRNQLGECSSSSLFKAISSAAINDGKQLRVNQRLEAESLRAQLPSAVGMTKQEKEQKEISRLLTEASQSIAASRADLTNPRNARLFDEDLKRRLTALKKGGKTRKRMRKLR